MLCRPTYVPNNGSVSVIALRLYYIYFQPCAGTRAKEGSGRLVHDTCSMVFGFHYNNINLWQFWEEILVLITALQDQRLSVTNFSSEKNFANVSTGLQWRVSSEVHVVVLICSHFFTSAVMTTGAFSWNIGWGLQGFSGEDMYLHSMSSMKAQQYSTSTDSIEAGETL